MDGIENGLRLWGRADPRKVIESLPVRFCAVDTLTFCGMAEVGDAMYFRASTRTVAAPFCSCSHGLCDHRRSSDSPEDRWRHARWSIHNVTSALGPKLHSPITSDWMDRFSPGLRLWVRLVAGKLPWPLPVRFCAVGRSMFSPVTGMGRHHLKSHSRASGWNRAQFVAAWPEWPLKIV